MECMRAAFLVMYNKNIFAGNGIGLEYINYSWVFG